MYIYVYELSISNFFDTHPPAELPEPGQHSQVNDRLPNDVLLIRIGSKAPMHAAILLPNERILYQKRNSLSRIEPFNAYYVRRTEAIFRYAAGNTPR